MDVAVTMESPLLLSRLSDLVSNSCLLGDVQESQSCPGLQPIRGPPLTPLPLSLTLGGRGEEMLIVMRREEEFFVFLFPGAHFTLGVCGLKMMIVVVVIVMMLVIDE